ncbi:MAG: ribose 5-phosphate isomerase A, partial [Planctomycetota bacterium]
MANDTTTSTTSTTGVSDTLAQEAVAPIESGMIVGLGTGRAAERGIRALAHRVKAETLDIQCVSTSDRSEKVAADLGLNCVDFASVETLNYLFDGADEVDPALGLMKGGGGAMTRERIIAWASERSVYMIGEEKRVERLGEKQPLAIAVMAFGLASVRAAIRDMGLNGVVRRDINGGIYLTDNGNVILDTRLEPDHNLDQLSHELNDIPGVIDHGLFLYEAGLV